MTREELYALANDFVRELAPPPPPPVPNTNTVGISIGDVYVAPGERLARVPVSLSAKPKQTVVYKYRTANGSGTNEGTHFQRAEGWLVFHPGEQFKAINVILLRDLSTVQNIQVLLTHPQNHPAGWVSDGTAVIHGNSAGAHVKAIPQVFGPPQKPTGLRKAFEETFGLNWQANDSGLLPDGTPCWMSRPGHGRTQDANKETGYYSDPIINPGTEPWLRDANGKLNLQLQYHPDGVKNQAGANIPCQWDSSGFFRYSASMISTLTMPIDITKGTYVEGRMTMPLVTGTWPAFWLIPKSWWTWPSMEIDLFEGFFNGGNGADKIGTTNHWKSPTGGHLSHSLRLPHLSVDFAQPQTWGWYWGETECTHYLNDVPYYSQPNTFPDMPCFIMLNIATGGLVGNVPNPATALPARMPLDWIRVWK